MKPGNYNDGPSLERLTGEDTRYSVQAVPAINSSLLLPSKRASYWPSTAHEQPHNRRHLRGRGVWRVGVV